jgi:hypothetical protein
MAATCILYTLQEMTLIGALFLKLNNSMKLQNMKCLSCHSKHETSCAYHLVLITDDNKEVCVSRCIFLPSSMEDDQLLKKLLLKECMG